MNRAGVVPRVTLACRDLGFNCEWAMRPRSADEGIARFRDHARCAHGMPQLGDDLLRRLRDALDSLDRVAF